jgi:hypothetical protein
LWSFAAEQPMRTQWPEGHEERFRKDVFTARESDEYSLNKIGAQIAYGLWYDSEIRKVPTYRSRRAGSPGSSSQTQQSRELLVCLFGSSEF